MVIILVGGELFATVKAAGGGRTAGHEDAQRPVLEGGPTIEDSRCRRGLSQRQPLQEDHWRFMWRSWRSHSLHSALSTPLQVKERQESEASLRDHRIAMPQSDQAVTTASRVGNASRSRAPGSYRIDRGRGRHRQGGRAGESSKYRPMR